MIKVKPSRYPSRSTEDKDTLYQIIDEGLFCTIAFNRNEIPHQIPTGFVRVEDHIYVHASVKSHFIKTIMDQLISFSITHLDSLVLAPTAFDHSFNYRSVIGFSEVEEITSPQKKLDLFNLFTDRYIPGRIADIGEPSQDQIAVTTIAKLSLENASAKIRTGNVDLMLDKFSPWCGTIPVEWNYGMPVVDNQLDKPLPDYLKRLISKSNE